MLQQKGLQLFTQTNPLPAGGLAVKIGLVRVYSEIAAIAKSLSRSCLLPQEFLLCRSVPFNLTAVTAPRPMAF
jgi:hypothetical protein